MVLHSARDFGTCGTPSIQCQIDDLIPGSRTLEGLRDLAGFVPLKEIGEEASGKIKFSGFRRAFNQDEGPTLINSKVGTNTFAADLGPILARYFTSHSQSDDEEIYDRAFRAYPVVTHTHYMYGVPSYGRQGCQSGN